MFLVADFNVVLLRYDKHDGANESINSRPCYMYLSYILHSFANIFSNYFSKQAVFGNLTSTIYDHLPQVLFTQSVFSENPDTKSNIFERSWRNFNQAEFVMDYFDKDCSNILNPKHGNFKQGQSLLTMLYLKDTST